MADHDPSAAEKGLHARAPAALRVLLGAFEPTREGHSGETENRLFEGCVSVVLRMVFLRFAEEQGLLPPSLTTLHDSLREARDRPAMDEPYDAWPRVTALSRSVYEARRGRLFDPSAHPFLEHARAISNGTLLEALDALQTPAGAMEVEHLGAAYEGLMDLEPGEARRRAGAHYTSRAMTAVMVARTLAPLLEECQSPGDILALRVCDPAMGSGAFLVEACRQLADRLVLAWDRTGTLPALPEGANPVLHARSLVAQTCLYGVDRNPVAVDLARLSLWLVSAARERPFTFVDHVLHHGDSLVGLSREQIARFAVDARPEATAPMASPMLLDDLRAAARSDEGARARARATGDLILTTFFTTREKKAKTRVESGPFATFHWEIELPEVFEAGRGGFDAILGNPPWVSYAGRAAQPLASDLRDYYMTTSPAFHGFRNLQGIFVHRSAMMLRPGGRLGLVLPTSMCDLQGYEPSRRAHDEWCVCDDELPDFGDEGFEGVFQPSMGLLSTRRAARVAITKTGPWPLARKDLDDTTMAILDQLSALPTLPPHLFGERGFQSMGDDVRRLHPIEAPEGALTTALRTGSDIEPSLRRPPKLHCDPSTLEGRFRPEADWKAVKLLIRQTARYPMVCLSDGQAFRNSILAGFSDDQRSPHLLLAYLNSSPIRWFHYMRHRDARQGMPQLKIGHLRALPDPPRGSPALPALERVGRELGEENAGISTAQQETIDSLVADVLGLDTSARAHIEAWARALRT